MGFVTLIGPIGFVSLIGSVGFISLTDFIGSVGFVGFLNFEVDVEGKGGSVEPVCFWTTKTKRKDFSVVIL